MHRITGYLCAAALAVVICVPASAQEGPVFPAPLENYSIEWMDWGDEAFDKAREQDRLIFLDISATWCHWCMVMDETTYKDPRVIKLINEEFVPVYVDTDERPDINEIYNQGGWPTINVLTPTGRIITGTTYVPANELLEILGRASETYKADRQGVYDKIEKMDAAVKEMREEKEKTQATSPLSAAIPAKALKAINLFVDTKYGGFGGPQKFPMPQILEFALYGYPKVGNIAEYSPEAALVLTLDNMADGLMDEGEGGFFRYSTSPDWKNPHYEKMLDTNGDLLGVYMRAYQLLGKKKYKKVAQSVDRYLTGVLRDDKTGAFFNSQAADEQYYRLAEGDREDMKRPPVNRVLYADANARAALGYLAAYRATEEPKYLKTALGALDYVISVLYDPGKGVMRSAGSDGSFVTLADHVYPALAAEQAYQATGDHRYLGFAVDVSSLMVKNFWDEKKGGFFDAAYFGRQQGSLSTRQKPQIENSKAAMMLMDLYHITGQAAYKQTAVRAIEPYTAEFAKHSYWAAPFAHAVERCIEETYEFIVIGKTADEGTRELVAKSFFYEDPDRVVLALDPDKDQARLNQLGYTYEGEPMLYVCSERACFPPVKPGDSLKKTRKSIEKAREKKKE